MVRTKHAYWNIKRQSIVIFSQLEFPFPILTCFGAGGAKSSPRRFRPRFTGSGLASWHRVRPKQSAANDFAHRKSSGGRRSQSERRPASSGAVALRSGAGANESGVFDTASPKR